MAYSFLKIESKEDCDAYFGSDQYEKDKNAARKKGEESRILGRIHSVALIFYGERTDAIIIDGLTPVQLVKQDLAQATTDSENTEPSNYGSVKFFPVGRHPSLHSQSSLLDLSSREGGNVSDDEDEDDDECCSSIRSCFRRWC